MSSVPQLAETEPAEEELGDLEVARRVLTTEADALTALSRALDQTFIAAVDCLAAVSGRVTVTGMGKSGHIARKIAATLASTGCPAQFVHPGEASHGDLGMITRDDAVLAMSNSGNTVELADLVAHCRRFGIPLIGMTSRQVAQEDLGILHQPMNEFRALRGIERDRDGELAPVVHVEAEVVAFERPVDLRRPADAAHGIAGERFHLDDPGT